MQTMKSSDVKTNNPAPDQIAALAHKIYMDSGEQQGRDLENWLQAEKTLRQQNPSMRTQSQQKTENGSQGRRPAQQF